MTSRIDARSAKIIVQAVDADALAAAGGIACSRARM